MKYFFHYLLIKDFRLLKFAFIIFASYLIFEEFYTYLVVKPTYTTTIKRYLKHEDFPEILLCPQPAIDVDAAKSKGYGKGIQQFFYGVLDGEVRNNTITWTGNGSEEVKKVSDEVASIKSVEDCPFGNESIMWFKNDDIWFVELINFKLSKALFPFHICCKVINPKNNTEQNPINGFQISFSSKNRKFDSFKVFFADQVTASFFDLNKRYVLDDDIVSSSNGIMNYKVKVLENENLEDDPKNLCIDYSFREVYGKCLESLVLRDAFNKKKSIWRDIVPISVYPLPHPSTREQNRRDIFLL